MGSLERLGRNREDKDRLTTEKLKHDGRTDGQKDKAGYRDFRVACTNIHTVSISSAEGACDLRPASEIITVK